MQVDDRDQLGMEVSGAVLAGVEVDAQGEVPDPASQVRAHALGQESVECLLGRRDERREIGGARVPSGAELEALRPRGFEESAWSHQDVRLPCLELIERLVDRV